MTSGATAAICRASSPKYTSPRLARDEVRAGLANAMPLAIGLAPSSRRAAVRDNLVADIRAHRNHVTAGDIGFHYVVLALMCSGRGDVLYDVNHFMLGDAETWLYGGLGGIRIDMSQRQPAKRIRIAPQAIDGIDEASARYRSVLGDVAASWRKGGGRLHLRVEIPAGAQATVEIPARSPAKLLESGRPLRLAHGITGTRQAGHAVVVTL
ncbi:MAG: alpha-L-rhamnosidase C-terminal domain-containing protein, partial [Steroidobacteraceae bacterium]